MRIAHLAVVSLAVVGCSKSTLSPTFPAVEVEPGIGFGMAYVGDEREGTFAVASTGTGKVRVRYATTDHPDLDLTWENDQTDRRGTPVPNGDTLDIRVRWTPVASGEVDTTVFVTTDVEGSEEWRVRVTGFARPIPDCNDGNACTDDRFERDAEVCVHDANESPCSDGSACTRDDTCHNGVCRGVARTCDDDNVCTLNLCDPAAGCVFPPDDIICDDGDPCTDNVCDPDDGCSYPNAATGTPCGAFDCAVGHICVWGTCHEIDIIGDSDGFPCFDGDLCTEGDTCQAGACVGGPVLQTEPEIVASFETFGGEGSFVATDGYRYLFADTDALRLAIPIGVNNTVISHVATLPLKSNLPPVLIQPGKFVVSTTFGLALIDATDVSAPFVAWEVAVMAPWITHLVAAEGGVVFASVPYGVPPPQSGVPANGSSDNQDSGMALLPESGPYYLPIDPVTGAPGFEHALASDYDIRDLDADGTSITWVSGTAMHWMRINANGNALVHLQSPLSNIAPRVRVSVHGDRFAVMGDATIQVWEVVEIPAQDPCAPTSMPTSMACVYLEPGCSAPALPAAGAYIQGCMNFQASCPAGTACQAVSIDPCVDLACDACGELSSACIPTASTELQMIASLPRAGAVDLVLSATRLHTIGSDGVRGISVPEGGSDESVASITWPIDPMAGWRLDAGPGHLLLAGPIALPLMSSDGSELGMPPPQDAPVPSFWRVSGHRHGNVVAITDGGNAKVMLGGRVAYGRIDLSDTTLVDWNLTPLTSTDENPRILRGATRDVAVETTVSFWSGYPCDPYLDYDCDLCAEEDMPAFQMLAANGVMESTTVCGIYGGTHDLIDGQLWYAGAIYPNIANAMPATGVRAWSLQNGTAPPLFQYEESAYNPLAGFRPWATRVRTSDGHDRVALVTPGSLSGVLDDYLYIRVLDPSDSIDPFRQEVTVISPRYYDVPARDRIGIDGSLIMIGHLGSAGMVDADPGAMADPIWPAGIDFPYADPARPVQIAWMNAGRAWIGWRAPEAPASGILSPGTRLAQISYAADGTMINEGEVELPGYLLRVFDTGGYTVATTPSEVVIIAPACL